MLGNPGFETGTAAWTATPAVIAENRPRAPAHRHLGRLAGRLRHHAHRHAVPVRDDPGSLHQHHVQLLDAHRHGRTTTTTAYDKLTITANGTTIATFSNLNHANGYQQHSYSLGSFAGQTVTLKFTGTEDSSLQTSFVVDDTAINTS